MNRKGSMLDLAFITVMIFVFAVVVIMAYNIYNSYTGALAGTAFDNAVNQEIVSDANRMLAIFDYVYGFFIVGLIITVVIGSFQLKTHPALFIVSVFLLVLLVVVGAVLSNTYTDLTTNTYLDDSSYQIIPLIMNNFPIVILMIGAIIAVALYAKSKWDDYS